MTLQELNDYIQDIIADPELQETCQLDLWENEDRWWQTIGREDGDEVKNGIYYDKDGTIVIFLYGGRNGDGNWVDYLDGIAKVLVAIEELPEVDLAYVVDLVNDCPDDVFTIRIAVRPTSGNSFEE